MFLSTEGENNFVIVILLHILSGYSSSVLVRHSQKNKLIVLIPVIHKVQLNQTFFSPSLPFSQKNIVHRDLKLGNMVLNKR